MAEAGGRSSSVTDDKEMRPSGNAVDVILVQHGEAFVSSEWHVMFGWSNFKSNVRAGVGDAIDIYVNDHRLNVTLKLLEYGRATFANADNEYLPPGSVDWSACSLRLDGRPNSVRFEHVRASRSYTRVIECDLYDSFSSYIVMMGLHRYVWQPDDFCVIADLDGTITISDVEGHIRTLRLGQYDFMHSGVCAFFTKLHDVGARILYLTARPLNWAGGSRVHLREARQDEVGLPPGPVITNSMGLTGALFTEVVHKNPHVFKAGILLSIKDAMLRAGRSVSYPVFVAGFGNRPTDTVAYTDVGVPKSTAFLIDPESKLQADGSEIFASYTDPKALLWLLPKIKYNVPVEYVRKIDELTAKELDREEEIELYFYIQSQRQSLLDEAASAIPPSTPIT
ncbi:lipin-like protein [Achlya hypogyna]|uniref:Lipin-like protein n=1 Tax=Achlya hypogyna TaxID=1202772 RepID=A0A1V9Y646_ACHHY|nr:lipin-like protein [Achlya hypogyna]